MFTEFLN